MAEVDREKSFGFVVLHYMAYDMTVECISTLIEHFGGKRIKIVLVDNASPNGSGHILRDQYESDSRVKVILNTENEGFARGNNIGYRYLVENEQPDYIVILNNDVLIEQDNFLSEIERIYQETEFAVLGPDIYNVYSKRHQNPVKTNGFTVKEVQKMYMRAVLRNGILPLVYWRDLLLKWLRNRKILVTPVSKKNDRSMMMENVVLHGACYIFSRDFMNHRTNCFLPDTFLYMEEDILHFECLSDGLKMVYSPDIRVKHLDDVATNAAIKSNYRRFCMKKKESKKSLKIFLKRMKQGDV